MADVLVGKAVADGRCPWLSPTLFKPGDGVTITPKVPRIYRPEDYGMDSKILEKIDGIAMEGIKAKAYPGCQILTF